MSKGDRSSRLSRILHALCNKLFAGDEDDKRAARLQWLSMFFGRTVTTSKLLTERELHQAVEQLMKEVPGDVADRYRFRERASGRPRRSAGKVVAMPNRSGATNRQVWKVRQLEQYLAWNAAPQRLEAFLFERYGVRRPDHLQFRQAGEVIEALVRIAARRDLKAQLGEEHAVTQPELVQAVADLKDRLRTWSPAGDAPETGSPV